MRIKRVPQLPEIGIFCLGLVCVGLALLLLRRTKAR